MLELFALLLFGALLRSLLRMLSACACVPVALRSGAEHLKFAAALPPFLALLCAERWLQQALETEETVNKVLIGLCAIIALVCGFFLARLSLLPAASVCTGVPVFKSQLAASAPAPDPSESAPAVCAADQIPTPASDEESTSKQVLVPASEPESARMPPPHTPEAPVVHHVHCASSYDGLVLRFAIFVGVTKYELCQGPASSYDVVFPAENRLGSTCVGRVDQAKLEDYQDSPLLKIMKITDQSIFGRAIHSMKPSRSHQLVGQTARTREDIAQWIVAYVSQNPYPRKNSQKHFKESLLAFLTE